MILFKEETLRFEFLQYYLPDYLAMAYVQDFINLTT